MTVIENNIQYTVDCPECSGLIVPISERGESVCSECGLVSGEKKFIISHGERRAFSTEDKARNTRTGSPISPLLPNLELCTLIDKKHIKNPDLKRAVKIDSQISWKTRNLLIATTELKRLCYNLDFPNYVAEESLNIYKKALGKNLLKGRSILGMIAACLYYTVKKNHIPRSFHEILKETSEDQRLVKKFYFTILKELNLKNEIINPIEFIPRYIGDLGLSIEIEHLVIRVLKKHLANKCVSGLNPKGLIAGAIYLIAKMKNKKISQKTVANIVGITEVSLRTRFQELKKTLNQNFD